VRGEGGRIGPELAEHRSDYESPPAWAAAMWAHTPRMAAVAGEQGVPYPQEEEPTVRSIGFGALALAIGFGIGLLAFSPSAAQVKVPPDFTFEKGKDSPGPSTFSHQKHQVKVDKCTACHVKIFKMKRGQSGTITLAALQEGKFCGACHDGKTQVGGTVVFPISACDKCHTS